MKPERSSADEVQVAYRPSTSAFCSRSVALLLQTPWFKTRNITINQVWQKCCRKTNLWGEAPVSNVLVSRRSKILRKQTFRDSASWLPRAKTFQLHLKMANVLGLVESPFQPAFSDLSHRAITRDLQHVSCKAHRVRGACNYSHEEGICPRAWTPQAQRKACRKFSYAALHSRPAPACLLGHLKRQIADDAWRGRRMTGSNLS